MKNIKTKKGFSLIEIMISVATAAVIFPAVISLMSISTFTTSQGEIYTKAYSIAQSEMENVYKLKKEDWDVNMVDGVSTKTNGNFNIKSEISPVNSEQKFIKITVSWNERGETKYVTVESLVADIW